MLPEATGYIAKIGPRYYASSMQISGEMRVLKGSRVR
jgi:hypothetical protein